MSNTEAATICIGEKLLQHTAHKTNRLVVLSISQGRHAWISTEDVVYVREAGAKTVVYTGGDEVSLSKSTFHHLQ